MFYSHMICLLKFLYYLYLDPIVHFDVVDQMFKYVGNYFLLRALITTSSPALYSHLLPFFPSNFLFIVSLVFFRASSISHFISLILSRNSFTVEIFSSVLLISLPVFGCLPKLTKKGDRPVLEWLQLLYTNSANGSYSTQSSCL